MEQMDYYETLRVPQDATQKQIKDAYRKLAFEYHPDRNRGNPESTAKMKSLNEAYAVLSNPAKRRDYDVYRRQYGSSAYGQFRQSYSENDIFRGSDINQILEEMARAFGFRGFEEIFRESYGQGYGRFEFKRPGFFARGFVFTAPSRRKNQNPMPYFPGGSLGRLSKYLLKKMGGIEFPENGDDVTETINLAPEEARNGGPYLHYYKKQSKKLVVMIPPGVHEGQLVRLAGMGDEGKGGGKHGDLYLRVRTQKPLLQKLKDFFTALRTYHKLPPP
jgi:DnaJ-class molecular chaperone